MELEMYTDSFSIGKVIFDFDNIPFKREGLIMGRMPYSNRVQIRYVKQENKKKEFLVIMCLNCGLYLVHNDEYESQIDCPYCGYSNELTDIRIEWWRVEDKD